MVKTLFQKHNLFVFVSGLQPNIHAGAGDATAESIRAATEALNTITEDFAAKRMDASVSRALAGKSLENLNL